MGARSRGWMGAPSACFGALLALLCFAAVCASDGATSAQDRRGGSSREFTVLPRGLSPAAVARAAGALATGISTPALAGSVLVKITILSQNHTPSSNTQP